LAIVAKPSINWQPVDDEAAGAGAAVGVGVGCVSVTVVAGWAPGPPLKTWTKIEAWSLRWTLVPLKVPAQQHCTTTPV